MINMDKSKFADKCPGELIEIDLPSVSGKSKKDWAFLPNEMPSDWEFPEKLWPLLADAKEAAGTLNGIGQTLSEPDLLLSPLQRREALTSSIIEGTYVTPEQLLVYELDPHESTSHTEAMSEEREVFDYGRALSKGRELLVELPICIRVIKEIHEVLMAGAQGRFKSPGKFREVQVQIGSSGRFMPPPESEVKRLMNNLELYINSSDDRYDPLIKCYIVHYQFETIHPFGDGNGRVGRVLLALMIYKCLQHSMPWLYLSAYFEKYKDEYVQNLFNVSAKNDWDTWIEFCLRGTIEQAEDSVRRCHDYKNLKEEFHDRVNSPTTRTHLIIEGLFKSPVLTIPKLAEKFDITYHTARKDVERLVNDGILKELSSRRPKYFYSPEIIEIYFDSDS